MFPTDEKLKCVVRELKMRREVYPRRVAAGKMPQARADREINLMEEIVRDYAMQAERERLL